MSTLPPEVIANLWRVSPAATAARLSREDREPWYPAPHLLFISDCIRKAVLHQGPRFNIVSCPVRHGKSEECSKWTPVWYLENWPHKRVMLCGHGGNFAAEWGGKVRNIVNDSQNLLSFSLAEDSQAKNRWNTSEGGGMKTAGVGGDITGRGADLMLIDDPVKNEEEANSIVIRDKIWNWWSSTASSRIEPGGVVFLIMARWHEDDLAGRLLNPEYNEGYADWNEINLPAIYDEEAAKFGPDPMGRDPKKITRVNVGGQMVDVQGEALWPWRWPLEELMIKKRLAASPGDWASLYQGRPARSSTIGNVYHSYHDTENVMRVERDPDLPLFWALDFNVDPMCSIMGQYREQITPRTILTNEKLITLEVLQEMCLPNSNTREACQEFVNRSKRYVNAARGRRVPLHIYGDVSGNKHSTNGDSTDYELIRDFFNRYPEYVVTYNIGTDNPAVKSRTNAVNLALKTADGFRRMFIDPGCVELRKDLREVKWKKDAGGNSTGIIDKDDRKRTHLSDALGYVTIQKFGIKPVFGEKPGMAQ